MTLLDDLDVEPGRCLLCSYPVFGVESHPCCVFWQAELESGRVCPSCSASRAAINRRNGSW